MSTTSRRTILGAALALPISSVPVTASAATTVVGPIEPPAVHVMSLNVRYDSGASWFSPDWWPGRRRVLHDLLDVEQPAVFAAQEVLAHQATEIDEMLPHHERHGSGRDDGAGAGEHCPIWWDTRRFAATEREQWWFSETPTVPGSIGPGAALPRVGVRVRLRDRYTSGEFDVINVHLSHVSERARRFSIEMLRERASSTVPTFVVGDFNAAAASSAEYDAARALGLSDAWLSASRQLTPAWGTFAGYMPPRAGAARIDWILHNKRLSVDSAAIISTRGAVRWASDHLAVSVVAELRSADDLGAVAHS